MDEYIVERSGSEISFNEFEEVCSSNLKLEISGEHSIVDGLTGEKSIIDGSNVFYFINDNKIMGYLEFENAKIYTHNISKSMLADLCSALGSDHAKVVY